MSQQSESGISEECAALRLRNSRLESEVTKLQAQLKAAETANAKWQVYDAQRNDQFHVLQRKLSDMETRVASAPAMASLSEEQQRNIDRIIMQSKQKVEEADQEKIKVNS